MKINRKKKEKTFKKLKKSNIGHMRIDQFGHYIDFNQFGMETDFGWTIVDNTACHWKSVEYI